MQCIKVLGGTHHVFAMVGDIIVVSVKEAIPNSKVKKGTIYKAVIVRTKNKVKRLDGSSIKFDSNAVVLVNNSSEPVGTRIFGAIAREVRAGGFLRIISLAPEVL